jgi:hypothetical protein
MSVMSHVMGWTFNTAARNQGAQISLGIRGEKQHGYVEVGLISIGGGLSDIDTWSLD